MQGQELAPPCQVGCSCPRYSSTVKSMRSELCAPQSEAGPKHAAACAVRRWAACNLCSEFQAFNQQHLFSPCCTCTTSVALYSVVRPLSFKHFPLPLGLPKQQELCVESGLTSTSSLLCTGQSPSCANPQAVLHRSAYPHLAAAGTFLCASIDGPMLVILHRLLRPKL